MQLNKMAMKQSHSAKNKNTKLKALLNHKKLISLCGFLVFVIFSAYYLNYIWVDGKNNTVNSILSDAKAIEVTLNGEVLQQLNALSSDENLPAYKEIKTKLNSLVGIYTEARFIYLLKKKGDKLFFIVDSEPENSSDYSPPGQEYSEDDPEARIPFSTGNLLISKPLADRWGTWVSVLIPVKDINSGKVLSVLGIDYPAEKWLKEAKLELLKASIIVLCFFLLLIALVVIYLKDSHAKFHYGKRVMAEDQMLALKAAIDQIDDIVVVKDLDLRVVATNNAFVQIAGKNSIDELIGRTDAEIYNIPADQEPIKSYMNDERHAQTLKIGEYILKEENLVKSDMETRIILTKKFPVYNDDEELIFTGSISRDITQRKQVEAELIIKEERYKDAQKIGNTGHWEFDIEKNKLYWSGQTYEIYEQDPEVFNPTFNSVMELYHPDDKEYILSQFKTCLETKCDLNIETRIITPSGSIKYTKQRAKFETAANEVFLVIGSVADITEQKLFEAELKNAKELAEIASVAKSDFLSNMSHEIRTPLNGVIGFTELLRGTQLNRIQKDYLDNAIVCANSLLSVISDILDFSKIEAGKLDLEFVRTDLVKLLESATDIIKVHAANKNIELLLSIQNDLPRFAIVDPIRLKQMMINLMSNAVKFTSEGEVELKITFEKKDDNTGFFTLTVRDTGIGIKEGDKGKLFKAFSQADASTTRRFGGTGLGLIISNSLAHKMGSRIQFESEFGKGSKFFFTFEAAFETTENQSAIPSKLIKRVLVIDDNSNNRAILEHTLSHWDIDFVGCESGYDGIEMLDKDPNFDLLIVDYHMPGIDGIETIKRIRQDARFSPENQSIIMLHSSSDDVEIHNAARELDIQYSLTKPIKSDELWEYLQNINVYNPEVVADEIVVEKTALQFDSELKILIAEDNMMNMMVITHMLRKILPNAKFLEANNGEEVLELLKTEIPDIILMDVQMPEMDGVEATKHIRANSCCSISKVPIVALTAGVSKDERENCYKAGMNYFLSKPIENNSLEEMLDKFLNNELPLTARMID